MFRPVHLVNINKFFLFLRELQCLNEFMIFLHIESVLVCRLAILPTTWGQIMNILVYIIPFPHAQRSLISYYHLDGVGLRADMLT